MINCGDPALLWQVLEVGAQSAADGAEHSIDALGQGLHAGSCTERDQGNDQGIFDQILADLLCHQALQSVDELQASGAHTLPR